MKKKNKKRLEWKLVSVVKIQLICKKNDDEFSLSNEEKKSVSKSMAFTIRSSYDIHM